MACSSERLVARVSIPNQRKRVEGIVFMVCLYFNFYSKFVLKIGFVFCLSRLSKIASSLAYRITRIQACEDAHITIYISQANTACK